MLGLRPIAGAPLASLAIEFAEVVEPGDSFGTVRHLRYLPFGDRVRRCAVWFACGLLLVTG